MGEAQGGFRGTENFAYLALGYGFVCVCVHSLIRTPVNYAIHCM